MTLTNVIMVLLISPFFVGISIFSYKAMRNFVSKTNEYESHPQYADLPRKGPIAGENNIFFVESSCAITDVLQLSSEKPERSSAGCGLQLTARMACAVEAAARLHPQRPVYVVHSCPLRCERGGGGGGAGPALARALQLPNVRLWHADFRALLRGSPVEALLHGALQRSRWPVEHASDLVRLVLLGRFGGTYLDMDVYLLRPLGEMRNFVCVLDNATVNNAVLDFGLDGVGRSALRAAFAALRDHFNPDLYAYNGATLLSDALSSRCGKRKFSTEEEEDCGGVRLLPPATFYPLPRDSWRRLFEEEGAEHTLRLVRQSVGVHVWGHNSRVAVHFRSRQPLAQLARDVCPSVVAAAPDSM